MAESTLSLSYADLANAISYYLGYGATAPTDAATVAEIDGIIQAGLRQFYFPPLVPGQNTTHYWTFLRPVTTISAYAALSIVADVTTDEEDDEFVFTRVNGDYFTQEMVGQSFTFSEAVGAVTITTFVSVSEIRASAGGAVATVDDLAMTFDPAGNYNLPDDFGGMIGDMTYPTNTGDTAVSSRGEAQIRALRQQQNNLTGRPVYAATRPLACDGTTGQRWELMLYPCPDTSYTLYYRYNVLPNKLTTGKYPYGGMQHAETILSSCLAIAEERINDTQGIHKAKFFERLVASVMVDRRQEPELLGSYREKVFSGDIAPVIDRFVNVTVNGVQY